MIQKRPFVAALVAAIVLSIGLVSGSAVLAAGGAPPIFTGATAGDLTWERTADDALLPRLPDTRPLAETDRPVLAVRNLNLLVPVDASIVGVEIVPLATHLEALPGELALGGELESSSGERVRVEDLALDGELYPQVWGRFGGTHVWRGFRLLSAQVFPLRLVGDGAGRWTALEVLDRYEVRPIYGDGPAPDVAVRKRLVPGERERSVTLLRAVIDNPERLGTYAREDGQLVAEPTSGFNPSKTPTLTGSAVSYLIITSSALASAFQPLADHRTATGMPAVVVTTEWITSNFRLGADIQETIRMFIREAYENWGVEYVLLGGDTDVLPARYVTSTYYPANGSTDIPVDLYFSCLDGNWNADGDYIFGEPFTHYLYPGDDCDMANDVYIGRATVSSAAEATVFVDKVVGYERTPSGENWTNRNLFAAEVLFPSDYTPGDYIVLDGADFADGIVYNYIVPCTSMEYVRMYETYALTDTLGTPVHPGSVPLTRDSLIDSLDTGHFGIVNQIGHGFFFNMSVGDANFVNNHADALVNGDHNFLLYALNCASCAFDYSCLMERFLKNPVGGSVASIGSARAAFPHTSNEYQEEFFHHLYCDVANRLGMLMSLSRLPFLASTYYNTVDRWTFMNYTLLGDPALPVWTDSPGNIDVAAPASLTTGAQTVGISVNMGGSPVDSALVCIMKSGDDYAYGATDATGSITLPLTPTSGGDLIVTVSGANLEWSQVTVPVTVGATYVAGTDLAVTDDGTLGSAGNGNGVPEAGETVALQLTVQDTGGGGATGCTAVIATAASGVSILNDTVSVGTVPPGGSQSSSGTFLVAFAPGTIDGTHIPLDLTVTDGGAATYESELSLTVLAPEAEPVALDWDDSTFGDGDNTVENGERIAVEIELKNFGAGLADEIVGTLRTLDPEVTLYDTVVTFTDIGLLESSVGDARFSLSDANAATLSWCWILFEDNHGRTFRHDFELQTPSIPTGVETDTSLGPDIIALRWLPIKDEGVRGYNLYRSLIPAGPFQRVNVDLIDGVSYFRDEGLATLTRYYYRITAVDSSLAEGAPSLMISKSTAPPEGTGFPLPFAVETSSHSAVGDINGDGVLDIALAADEVYVWTAAGDELFDGDTNAQTHGPITDLDVDFATAGLALAELDGRPGLEIIASDKTNKRIHIFRHDGTELPGWPRQMRTANNGWNWTAPAVGDVDGDGDQEIVVNTLDGRTWVWHHDGTELRDGDSDPGTVGVFVVRPEGPFEWSFSSPALFDCDGDGAKEVIFGTKYGSTYPNYLYAFRYDGTQAAGFPYSLGVGSVQCSPSVADLNDDGTWEIVFHTQNDYLYVVQQDGTDYPGFPITFISNSNTIPSPSPAFGDFDGDGELEIVDIATVGGDEAHLYVIDTDIVGGTSGDALPGWPQVLPGNSEASPVVGDVDGDGVPDILHGIGGGSEDSPNNLYAFKANGFLVDGFPITLGGPLRPSPVICDLDEDGDVDIVHGGWDMLIHVWDLPFAWNRANVPWPTFRGHFLRDGVFRPATIIDVPDVPTPRQLVVEDPYPNPFNPSTNVKLYIPGAGDTTQPLELRVYNLQGRLVRTLHAGPVAPGWRTWVWDGRDEAGKLQASGMYFLRARLNENVSTRKMSLIK